MPLTQPGGALTAMPTSAPGAERTLAARLKVGALTLAFGALIGAVVALTVLRSSPGGNSNADDQGPSKSPSITSTGVGGSSPLPSASDAAAASQQAGLGGPLDSSPLADSGQDTIQWQGSLTFGKNGISFDAIPPDDSAIYADMAYVGSTNSSSGYNFSASWAMALWTGTGVPSRSQCADMIQGSSSNGAVVPIGGLLCVKSLDSRLALVQIQSVDASTNLVTAYVRVWAVQIGQ
jgi:hypothetical protein